MQRLLCSLFADIYIICVHSFYLFSTQQQIFFKITKHRHITVIPALRNLRQEVHKLKGSLGYTVKLCQKEKEEGKGRRVGEKKGGRAARRTMFLCSINFM